MNHDEPKFRVTLASATVVDVFGVERARQYARAGFAVAPNPFFRDREAATIAYAPKCSEPLRRYPFIVRPKTEDDEEW